MSRSRRRPWTEIQREMVNSPARAVGTLYRRFQEAARERYAQRGWTDATVSHVKFLAEIDEAGTRLSDIATALGTTKQHVGKLARDLETKGLVTLTIDPSDRRATLAMPTNDGRAFFQDACEVRAELEAKLFAGFSPARLATFVAMLGDMLEARLD